MVYIVIFVHCGPIQKIIYKGSLTDQSSLYWVTLGANSRAHDNGSSRAQATDKRNNGLGGYMAVHITFSSFLRKINIKWERSIKFPYLSWKITTAWSVLTIFGFSIKFSKLFYILVHHGMFEDQQVTQFHQMQNIFNLWGKLFGRAGATYSVSGALHKQTQPKTPKANLSAQIALGERQNIQRIQYYFWNWDIWF